MGNGISLVGWVTISAKQVNEMKAIEPKEWSLTMRTTGDKELECKVKISILRLDSETSVWFGVF